MAHKPKKDQKEDVTRQGRSDDESRSERTRDGSAPEEIDTDMEDTDEWEDEDRDEDIRPGERGSNRNRRNSIS